MKTFETLRTLLEETQHDVDKFANNGNKSAGTRIRQAMQEVKKLAQEVRIEIQEAKNNS